MRFGTAYLCLGLLACSAQYTASATTPDASGNLAEEFQSDTAEKQFALGQLFKHGHNGTGIDLDKAEALFALAAASGHAPAEDEYGLILFQNGKERDALPWLEKAVARGEPRAQYLLGTALFNGMFIAQDWRRAYALMLRSTASGLDQARYTLAQMDQFIPLEERRRGAALAQQMETAQANAIARIPDAPGASYDPPGLTQPSILAAHTLSGNAPPPSPDEFEGHEETLFTGDDTNTEAPTYFLDVLETGSRPAQSEQGRWRIQLGAFRDKSRAPALRHKIHATATLPANSIYYFVSSGTLTRLLAGPFKSGTEAAAACRRLRTRGHTACLPIGP